MSVRSLARSGLINFAETRSMLVGNATYIEPNYDLIESAFLTSDTSFVTFNNLEAYASTYKHLQIRLTARTDRASQTGDVLTVRFNDDSGSNYAYHQLYGNGSSVISNGVSSSTEMWLWRIAAPLSTPNAFGGMVIDILDPYSAKNKTVRALAGLAATNDIYINSGLWNNTASLASITLDQLGNNFVAGSRFSLYGIKG